MKTAPLALLLAAFTLAGIACNKAPEAPKAAAYQPKLGETHTTTGVIKEFASENKVVVLQHQAFPDGFMEGMTMSFQLADPKLAKGLKLGDKVEFTLQYTGTGFPITSIKKLKQSP